MRKTLLALGVLFIYGISSGELLACGDKFLVASRGTRYQRAGQARHGASILVYMHAVVHDSESLRTSLGGCDQEGRLPRDQGGKRE